jgi:hypothetical protein
MHGINLMKAFKSIEYLLKETDSFSLGYFSFLLTIFLEITSITKLGDNKYSISRAKRINELDYILTFNAF